MKGVHSLSEALPSTGNQSDVTGEHLHVQILLLKKGMLFHMHLNDMPLLSKPDSAFTLLFTLLPSPRSRLHAVSSFQCCMAWQGPNSLYMSITDALAREMWNSVCTAHWKADWQSQPGEESEHLITFQAHILWYVFVSCV